MVSTMTMTRDIEPKKVAPIMMVNSSFVKRHRGHQQEQPFDALVLPMFGHCRNPELMQYIFP